MAKLLNFKNITFKNIAFFSAMFFVLDRFFKMLALGRESLGALEIFGNILSFNLAKNYFISFSLPISGGLLTLLLVISFFIIFYYFFLFLKKGKKYFNRAYALIFLLTGAFSNLFDRIFYGYVIDYLDFLNINVFNIADLMIIVSAIIFLSLELLPRKKNN